MILDGQDVTDELRQPAVEANVSAYSAVPAVRDVMVARQRAFAADGRAVLAGRDIGTVVLPAAPVKIFLTASEESRAERRKVQAAEWGTTQDVSGAAKDIAGRDRVDSSRAASPLVLADGARIIDTSSLTIDQTIAAARRALMAPSQPAPAAAAASQPRPQRARSSRRARIKRWRQRRPEITKIVSPQFYWAANYLIRLAAWLVTRTKVSGREHIPSTGGFILVSNHLNNMDPFILSAAIRNRRRIRFMAKVELFQKGIWIIANLWGAFPVRRGEADLGAMLTAERLLRKGVAIGMFPEGTRSRSQTLGQFHPGTALIGLRAGVPILPAAVTGTEAIKGFFFWLRRPKITVTFAPIIETTAIKRPSEADVSGLTNRILTEISSRLPASYRPAYTGEEVPYTPDGPDHPRQ
jgi:1-acyl-sn-glycerol-3-phosphate acyltransferase